MKKYFEDTIQIYYKQYSFLYENTNQKCQEISGLLGEMKELIEFANNVKCQPVGGKPESSPCAKTALTSGKIQSKTKELSNCVRDLRAKRNVENKKMEGENIIKEVNSLIGNLTSDERKCGDVKEKIDNFRTVEGAFRKRL